MTMMPTTPPTTAPTMTPVLLLEWLPPVVEVMEVVKISGTVLVT
jgi:hypothetical protein